MKLSFLSFLMAAAIYSFGQPVKDSSHALKQLPAPKHFIITVDSAHAKQFLFIIETGLEFLKKTSIPANQVDETTAYGTNILRQGVANYNSWFVKPKPDSTAAKPKKVQP